MFPISMAAQHRHLAGALAKIVSQLAIFIRVDGRVA